MTDREKVIKGLSCHISDPDGHLNCAECPYSIKEMSNSVGCLNRLHIDALELMKQQPEIVRCKDCRHGKLYAPNCIDCELNELAKDEDWFCADGERI